MRFLTSTLLAFLILSQYAFGLAERDFRSKNGQVIKGTIIKYFEDGDVLLKRSKDLQMFRISLEIFTEDDQAFVKNNFPPNHDALPEFKRPLSPQVLMTNSRFIDNIIDTKLRSYNQRPNPVVSDEVFLRQPLKIIGRIQHLRNKNSLLQETAVANAPCWWTNFWPARDTTVIGFTFGPISLEQKTASVIACRENLTLTT